MTSHELARDLLIAAVSVRVLGRDALALLRRAAAAGVRVGVNELHDPARRSRGGRR
ncbi:hypothetical protein [Streptomyces armeniacus]|uniref:hypothetical protein n=1 Tax=Streptomyces armeniacus TaxID=83291 RepID=UPI001AD8309F|nr:hypothetical protein [Streptomyces armeniacus]